ncbi:hypothetical protein CH296_18960 [Rhodococcus sp. 14-2496-1d]|uniref:DUF2637 domain-containing protein n=1 Tax=Rhodococcus sp. 14-2496-1d TaxID=2023146 RepID=UPI000B9AB811|nr:DUF2637 domain-containing protein [Rhodococcus sp. 14-2496-1d]OZF28234.1 hypothetical protein CH296_18960 [Rhodococcus sp. 14-2496-1d]
MSRFPSAASIAGTILIALGAFWLSFTALRDLADRSGVPTSQSWVWPLIVDGLVLVATVAVVALHEHRWYAWSLLATGAVISLAGNTLHATYTGDLPIAVRVLVAAVPPLSLLAVTHLTYLLSRRPRLINETSSAITTIAPTPILPRSKGFESEVPDLGASFRNARRAG